MPTLECSVHDGLRNAMNTINQMTLAAAMMASQRIAVDFGMSMELHRLNMRRM
jgi:hypothetical protein